PVSFGANVVNFADEVGCEQRLGFNKGSKKAIVISNLIHETFVSRQRSQFTTFGTVEAKRLLAEHMQILVECSLDHCAMKTRWRRNKHGIQRLFLQQFRVVAVRL